jgi:REP element-mobilizing transposase RayT
MPRKPRIHLPGGFYHVMLRGNGGQDIFLDPQDGRLFLTILAEAAERSGMRIHAWCLMPNHAHLLLQVGVEPLSHAMQRVTQRYTGRINKREQRAGHLFQGRYKAVLVDADGYLLALARYIHLNPVRAGLAKAPDAWRWSSHRAYLGLDDAPFLTTDDLLGRFAGPRKTAIKRYRAFIAEGMGEAAPDLFDRPAGAQGRVLGGEDFVAAALKQAGEAAARKAKPPGQAAIVEAVCAAWGVARDEIDGPSRARLASEARGVAALIARETGAATLTAMAAHFGRDLSSLSRVLQHVEARAAADPDFAKRIQRLQNTIIRA